MITDVVSEQHKMTRTCDLGLNGCFVPTPSPFKKGAKIRIAIAYAGAKVEAFGRVAHTRAEGMGIAFTKIEPHYQAVLDRWMSELPATNLMAYPPISPDKMNRTVVAFLDGKRVKGYVLNFSPLKETFKLAPNKPTQLQSGSHISMKDLKAIFFVKDFAGNPDYDETPKDDEPKYGRKILVTFKDGEELSGTTEAYNPRRLGFFMFPVDKDSNNLRIFVINRNILQVKMN